MKNIIRITVVLAGCAMVSASARADLLGLSNPADLAGMTNFQLYSLATLFAGSDYIAVNQASGNWNGSYTPRDGKNLSLLTGRVEAGASWGSWRIAVFDRVEGVAQSNRDTTNVVYDNKQNLAMPAGQNLIAYLNLQFFLADGVRLDKGFLVNGSDGTQYAFGAGFSLLNGTRSRFTSLGGVASSTSAGYSFDANLQDANSRGNYPFISTATPSGTGYSMDLGGKIVWTNGSRLDVAANDLFGRIYWHNMPYTTETANSATLTRNAAGYISYNPTISGVNALNRTSVVQALNPKVFTQYTYPVANVDLCAGTDWILGYWLPQIGTAYHVNANWKTSLNYDFRFNTVGVGIENKWFYINAESQTLSLATSKAFGASVGVHASF